MTETITCIVEFDGKRDVYEVEFEGAENRHIAERTLRRMVAHKIDPTIDAERDMLVEMMSFMKSDGDLLAGVCRAAEEKITK